MNIVDGRFFQCVSSRRTKNGYLRTVEWSGNDDVIIWINRCKAFRSRQNPLGDFPGTLGRLNLSEALDLQRDELVNVIRITEISPHAPLYLV